MAYKVFTNGSVLPASDVNDYLMRQSVMVFATAAARAAAITGPTEGMLTWLEDVHQFEYYTGTAWADLTDEPSGWSDKAANYSVVAADLGTTIRSTGSAITITIDNVLTQQGDRIDFLQAGAGQITFAAGAGVTLSSRSGLLKTSGQFAAATVLFGGTGVYYLIGNLGS